VKKWLSSEYHKLGLYENFKAKIKDLLWNNMKQAHVRANIYNDRYDRSGNESMTEHYTQYASLAANLVSPV
jgi:hypothetical protein